MTCCSRAFLIATLAWSLAGTAQQPASKPLVPKIQETLITQFSGRGKVLDYFSYGQDGVMWLEAYPNNTQAVMVNGTQMGDYYDEVKWSGHSEVHLQWIYATRRKKQWVLVKNGKDATAAYDEMLPGSINAEGRFMVCARKDHKWRMVIDGQETGPEFDAMSPGGFNRSGDHYFAMGKRNNKWIGVLDGKEFGSEADEATELWWFEAGHTVALVKINHRWSWLVDGQPGPPFEVVSMPEFTPDGKHYTYAGASTASGQVTGSIVIDGKITVSNAGAHIGGNWFTGRQLKPGVIQFTSSGHGVSDPKIADDGTVSYALRKGDKQIAVQWNGVAGPVFEDILSEIAITRDGKHIAYIGKRGDLVFQVRDQQVGPSFSAHATLTVVPWIFLSADGSRLGYEIVRGGHSFKAGIGDMAWRRVVVDGNGAEYHALSAEGFQFSQDGKHYSWVAESGPPDHHQDWVIFDGVDGPRYDSIFYDFVRFVDDHTIEYTARNGNRMLKITEKLQ